MAEIIFGYGIHFEENEKFVKENGELIAEIRTAEKQLFRKDKTICEIGGNWDLSYFIGVVISNIDSTSTSLKEMQNFLNEPYWKQSFNDRLSKYPQLVNALAKYQDYIDFKIILDRE